MKKLVIGFLILGCGVCIPVLYYYWRQATQLPEWYAAQSSSTLRTLNFSNSSELRAARARLQEKIEASIAKSPAATPKNSLPLVSRTNSSNYSSGQAPSNASQIDTNKNVEVELSDREVNELAMATIAERTGHSQVLANVPSLHTQIKDGVLESGTVVNLADFPKNQLAEGEVAALGKVLKTFPFLENKELYIGISGKPQIENGQLKWDKHTKVKLGNLSLSLSELSQQLNIPQEKLEEKLNLSLAVGRLKVNNLEVTDNKVLLRGSVNQ
jgi:anti-sigma28 factor (negative regulator of flagellin synthesis)